MGSSTSTSKSSSRSEAIGPGQSLAMSGTTGLAGATEKEAQTIKRTTGKSFKAIGQQIGEVGSKYRRPADVEKYAKNLQVIEAGEVLGAKKFVGPDGVERVNMLGTGMKDEQGRTILSKTVPGLTAKTPTLKQLGGDISRGLMGYNSIKYIDDKPTMVETKGLVGTIAEGAMSGAFSPTLNLLKSGVSFFQNKDDTPKAPTGIVKPGTPTQEFADAQAKEKIKKKLAGSLDSSIAKNRSLFSTQTRTITGGMA